MAALQHPYIVRIYDSGVTDDGYPYYVMEYVDGVPLDQWPAGAIGGALISEVLELFAKIGEAVNYAHQRGVIHRDLKPSNIRIDADGEPHILDFGLAKSAAQPGGVTAPYMTATGQFMGSLPWASPEQAEGDPSHIDVRTDVYSLGVLLYQMLTGHFPYDVVGSFSDVIDHIRHTPPARPSTLRPEIDDELQTIVLKAVAKEPQRRYQSAGELARDIRHYLNHEPIEAKRDSAWYSVKKTLRRYRVAVGVTTAFFVVAVGVAISTSVLYARARAAERTAEERRTLAETETDKSRRRQRFLEGMFASLDPTKTEGRDTTLLHEILDDAARRVPAELGGQAEVEAPVRATIGRTYSNLGDYAAAEENLSAALQLYRSFAGEQSAETLGVMTDLSGVYQERGRFTDAEPLARAALDGFRRAVGDEHRDTLTALNNLALLLDNKGQKDEAEALHRQTLETRRRVLGADDPDTISSQGNLAQILLDRGDFDEGAPLIRDVLAARRRVLGPDHPDTLISLNNAARLAQEQGELEEAETLYRQAYEGCRRALGDAHPRTRTAMSNLAVVCRQRGNLAEAETLLRAALELQRRTIADADPAAVYLLNNLARTLQDAGKLDEAEPLLRRVLGTVQSAYGEDHPHTASATNNLAGLLADLHRLDEAIELFRHCVEIRRRTLGPDRPDTLLASVNLAATLRDAGRLDEALALFDETAATATALPPEHWIVPFVRGGHGETLCLLKRYDEAEPVLLESYRAFQAKMGDAHPLTRKAATRLFNLYTAWGKPAQAAEYASGKPE